MMGEQQVSEGRQAERQQATGESWLQHDLSSVARLSVLGPKPHCRLPCERSTEGGQYDAGAAWRAAMAVIMHVSVGKEGVCTGCTTDGDHQMRADWAWHVAGPEAGHHKGQACREDASGIVGVQRRSAQCQWQRERANASSQGQEQAAEGHGEW